MNNVTFNVTFECEAIWRKWVNRQKLLLFLKDLQGTSYACKEVIDLTLGINEFTVRLSALKCFWLGNINKNYLQLKGQKYYKFKKFLLRIKIKMRRKYFESNWKVICHSHFSFIWHSSRLFVIYFERQYFWH